MKGVVAIVVLAFAGVCFGYLNPTLTVSNGEDLFPEGIAYDSVKDLFYLSSLSASVISIVSPTTGLAVGVINDAELTGYSTLGLAIDENSNPRRLLVAGINQLVFPYILGASASLPATTSMLFAFELNTNTLLWAANLTGSVGEPNFANDIAIDTDGTAYVTDSLLMQIWAVTSEGDSSVYLKDQVNFSFNQADFVGINGIKIVGTGDSRKLIVNKSGGKLYQVPVGSASPTATNIPITTEAGASSDITGATDGLFVFGSNVVTAGDMDVVSLRSTDNWATAIIDDWQELSEGGVSTVTDYDGAAAVIHGFGTAFLMGATGIIPFIELVRIDTDSDSEPSPYELVSGVYYNNGQCVEAVTCCCHVGPITIVGPMPYTIGGKYPVLVYGSVSGAGCFGATIGGYNLTFDTDSSVDLSGDLTLVVGPVTIEVGLTLVFDEDYHGAMLTNDQSATCINAWTDVPTTCDDEWKNGDEAGVDCGGSCPAACPDNTCSDGEKNGDEVGVDCGGSCIVECPSGYMAASGFYTPDGDCVPGEYCCCYTGVLKADGYMYENSLYVTSGLDGGAGCAGLTYAAYNMTFSSLTDASVSLMYGSIPFSIDMDFEDDYSSVSVGNSLLICTTELTRNAPTCDDGFMNGDETAVDIGGSCGEPIDSVAEATGTWVSDGSCVPSALCCCYQDAVMRDNGAGLLYAGGHVEGAACQGITYGSYNMSFGEDPYQAAVTVEILGFDVTLTMTFGEDWETAVLTNSIFTDCINNIVRATEVPTTCADATMNGDETGVDCGGSCDACATCDDGVKNQDEEDIDCGGAVCEECPSEASGSVLSVSVAALLVAVVAALFKA